jgi:LysR substrate binding domain
VGSQASERRRRAAVQSSVTFINPERQLGVGCQSTAYSGNSTAWPEVRRSTVRMTDLEGAPLVHFAPENGLSTWLDQSLTRAGVRPGPVMRTSVTSAAPQLAAAGLGIAVSPVSALSAGFPGAVRSFSPQWVRQLVAVTPAAPDPLAARFISNLRTRGVRVPSDVRSRRRSEPRPAQQRERWGR